MSSVILVIQFLDDVNSHPIVNDSCHPVLNGVNYHPFLEDINYHPIVDDSCHPVFELLENMLVKLAPICW